MAALLVAIAVMSVMLGAAMPVWRTALKREHEAELIFRGEQYARAIAVFQRKFPGALPPSVDLLVQQRFLRRKYRDPMTKDGEFQLLYQTAVSPQAGGGAQSGRPGAPATTQQRPQPATTIATPTAVGGGTSLPGARGGIIGVASKSKETSLRLYNGRDKYNEWQFVFSAPTQRPGAAPGAGQPGVQPGMPGQPRPGMPGGPGRPGGLTPGMPGPRPITPGQPLPPGRPRPPD